MLYYWACWHRSFVSSDRIMVLKGFFKPTDTMLISWLPLKIRNVSQNPVITNSIKTWIRSHSYYGLNKPSIFAPIVENHLIPASLLEPIFNIWWNLIQVIPISDSHWEHIKHTNKLICLSCVLSIAFCNVWFSSECTAQMLAWRRCNRCKWSPANHSNIFWSCLKLVGFWCYFFDTLVFVLYMDLSPELYTALFDSLPLMAPNFLVMMHQVLFKFSLLHTVAGLGRS